MRKIFVAAFALMLGVSAFAQQNYSSFGDDKSHTYTTTMSSLYHRRVWEEVVIQNNSSFELNNISCEIFLGDIPTGHRLVNIRRVKIGDDESFDGYEDDELKDELPFYFGRLGKFRADNSAKISFKLNFGVNDSNVKISSVYNKDKNLVFLITDSENAVKPNERIESLGGNVIEIDGKKFLLYNGQAIQVK